MNYIKKISYKKIRYAFYAIVSNNISITIINKGI